MLQRIYGGIMQKSLMSRKKSVSNKDVIRLMELFQNYQNVMIKLDEIDIEAQRITGEIDAFGDNEIGGHTHDYLNGFRNVYQLIEFLGLKIE